MKNVSAKTLSLVQLALFAAIIVLMTLIPFLGYIPLGAIRATIIHVPVIIGSIILGPKKGAILGALFGLTSLITNTVNPMPTSFVFTPFFSAGDLGGSPLSLVICFVPRILVGIVPYYVYRGLSRIFRKKRGTDTLSLTVAGLCGSLTNTLLVMNMIYFFFGHQYAQVKELSFGALYTALIIPTIAVNGVLEAIVAAVLSLAVAKPLMKYTK